MASPVEISPEKYASLKASLLNESGNVPMHARFRVLFTLKALKSPEAVEIISAGFQDDSALLKHELAYCLGQMRDPVALPVLESVLRNPSQDPMTRHEAAEAMGAISMQESVSVLEEFTKDPNRVVRESCDLAIAKIQWDHSEEGQKFHKGIEEVDNRRYTAIDPAPPSSGFLDSKLVEGSNKDIPSLKSVYLDSSRHLFERYRAMFALRDINTPESINALSEGFRDESELFRHEVAFVFGQMQSPHSVPALVKVLNDQNESEIVRHEAADALGSIATPEVLPHVKEWLNRDDSPPVVRESCQVALDMWEYENSDQFHYADGLTSNPAPQDVKA